MFNIALGISILIAAFLPIGQWLLLWVATPKTISATVGSFGTHMLLIFLKYLLPALLLYGVFRLSGLQRKWNFKARGSTLILIANLLVLFFALVRAFASRVEGGGASFVVAQFGAFVFWPAWLAIVVGLFLLVRAQSSPDIGK